MFFGIKKIKVKLGSRKNWREELRKIECECYECLPLRENTEAFIGKLLKDIGYE